MKIALIGDIHANLPALEAVLADARAVLPEGVGTPFLRAGLSGGEQLLIGGVETPTEGMRVKIGT